MNGDQTLENSTAALRERFPCEPEIDRVLTRKLKRRSGAGYVPNTLEELVSCTHQFVAAHVGGEYQITEAQWLSGGASKLQVAFKLNWDHPTRGREVTHMVLRMEPAASLVESSRLREFQIISMLDGKIPVPRAYWVDVEGEFLPYPAIVYEFVNGVTKPTDSTSQASGMGTVMPPQWRAVLGPQFADTLARIHCVAIDEQELNAFISPTPGTQSLELALNHWERVWEEDMDEDIPLIRYACAWLRANMPNCERPVILHGDYRVGNFLFNEQSAKITAVLDWEMARIGDPHFDLAWAANPAYGGYSEEDSTFLVGGFMPEEEFLNRYEARADIRVDVKTLYYHKVYCGWMQGIVSYATAWRVARYGRSHQDALLAWIIGIGPKLLHELRDLLERGA